MIRPLSFLAFAVVVWSIGIGLWLWAVLFWAYGWYRVTAWLGWPVALLFVWGMTR